MAQYLKYRFGPFELTPANFELKVGSEVLHLEPKVFSLLHLLVSNQGELVSKELMLSEIWLDVEVGDSAITRAIKEIRKLLETHSSVNHWIQTHYGQGYRFIINVEVIEQLTQQENEVKRHNSAASPDLTSREKPKFSSDNIALRWFGLIKQLANSLSIPVRSSFAIILPMAIYLFTQNTQEVDTNTSRSIVVLPIKDLANDSRFSHLSAGLTDVLIGKLAQLPDFKVISRTSSMTYFDSNKSPRLIGEELDVGHLLEGSLIKDRENILVNLRLVNTQNEKLIWSKDFKTPINEIVTRYSEFAEEIKSYIQERFVFSENVTSKHLNVHNYHTDAKTYRLYLEGLYYLRIRRSVNLMSAKLLFLRAIEADENYAPAWAALAHTHIQLANYSAADYIESLTSAKKALDTALALNPNLADAWSALGQYEFGYTYDWDAAKKAYQKSLKLRPSNSSTLQWYAEVLAITGEQEKSLEIIQRAFEIDPANPLISVVWGICLTMAGEQKKAIEKYNFALILNPKFFWIHRNLSYSNSKLGNTEKALEHRLLEMKKAGVHSVEELQRLNQMSRKNGLKGFWLWSLETLFEQKKTQFIPLTLIAEAYAGIDDFNNMLHWLFLAIEAKGEYPQHLLMRSPEFSKYKDKKEFQQIMKILNLPLDKI